VYISVVRHPSLCQTECSGSHVESSITEARVLADSVGMLDFTEPPSELEEYPATAIDGLGMSGGLLKLYSTCLILPPFINESSVIIPTKRGSIIAAEVFIIFTIRVCIAFISLSFSSAQDFRE
jgi:hypothetical protein